MDKMSNNLKYSLAVAPLTSFTFGITLTTFEILKETLLKHMTNEQWDYAISIFCIGALLSNLTINMLRVTIKTKIIIAQLCFVIGTLLLFIYNFYVVMLGRLFHGLGSGIVCCVLPLYLNTLAPLRYSGTVGCLHQLGIVSGLLAGQIMSYYFDKKDAEIPFMMLTSFLIGLLASLCFIQNIVTQEVKRKSIVDLVRNVYARKSLVVSIIFHLGQQLSCINGVVFYSNTILEKTGDAKLKTVYVGIVSLLSSILAMFVVDKAGRKLMYLLSCFICCISLAVISFEKYVIYMLFIFMFGFNIGLGPVSWLAVGEIFDEEYKSAGSEIAVGANWISNYGILLIFSKLMNYMGMKSFLVFSGALVCVMGLIAVLFTETKGKPSGFLK